MLIRAEAQRRVVSAVDSLRERALPPGYPTLCDELPPEELDARLLVLELCQPLDHLREEYERVFCVRRIEPACSPYELNHRDGADGVSWQSRWPTWPASTAPPDSPKRAALPHASRPYRLRARVRGLADRKEASVRPAWPAWIDDAADGGRVL